MAFPHAGHAPLTAVVALDLRLGCFGGLCGAVLAVLGGLSRRRASTRG